MKVYSRFSLLILTFWACSGCSGLPSRQPPLSKNAVRLSLPFEAQSDFDRCGIATVHMLTAYYRKPLSAGQEQGLLQEVLATHGVSGASLKGALEQAGYAVEVFKGTLDHQATGLYRHLDLKRPCIVMTGSQPRHYSVVAGYDPGSAVLLLLDPARGPVAVPVQSFMAEWKQANCFTLLAVPAAL